jgi:epoxyqueuosine reductase
MRNACIAAANWGDASLLPALNRLATDEEPLIRSHALWAISQVRH